MAGARLKAKELGLGFRLMFQDEARFGRMSLPYQAWAPAPLRPLVELALVREFKYVYCAVAPADGQTVWMVCDQMNTEHMGRFLKDVAGKFPDDLILMILDGASSHKAKALGVPDNIVIHVLPPYSPELNPVEHIWDEMREKFFANKIFNTMTKCVAQIEQAVACISSWTDGMRKLTEWPWIKSCNLTLA
ncbi:MAG: IS630 family transposase [Lentisphaeria bacterium]